MPPLILVRAAVLGAGNLLGFGEGYVRSWFGSNGGCIGYILDMAWGNAHYGGNEPLPPWGWA